jgi:thiol-disulfide isomerase/thioredoxin
MNRRLVLMGSLAAALLPGVSRLGLAQPRWELGQKVDLPTLELLDGSTVDWKALQGKVIVLEFWGSWCPFCARQNPLLNSFYKEHRARGLEVITISLDKTKQGAIDYMKKGGYAFKAGMTTPEWSAIYRQRKGLPQLFVIDRQGRLAMIEVREVMEDDIRDIARFL